MVVFFFKQKTAYEMRISDWSSDVCSSDLSARDPTIIVAGVEDRRQLGAPRIVGQPQVDEPRPRDRHRLDFLQGTEFGRDSLRQRARVGARGLGEHHRRVGGEIAVRGIARSGERRVGKEGGSTGSSRWWP